MCLLFTLFLNVFANERHFSLFEHRRFLKSIWQCGRFSKPDFARATFSFPIIIIPISIIVLVILLFRCLNVSFLIF